MNTRLVLAMSLVCVLVACAASKDQGELPTLAALPTPIGQEISLSTSTPTQTLPPPTFTLVPSVSAIDQELTRVFSDPFLYQSIEDSNATGQAGMDIPYRTLEPTQLHRRIENHAYFKLGFEIIEQAMEVEGVQSVVTGTSMKPGMRFQYQYKTDIYPFDISQRVPDLLCNLKDAGFLDQEIKFTVEQRKIDGSFYQGSLFCIAPEVIQSLNCTIPSQMDLDAIQTSPGCDYN